MVSSPSRPMSAIECRMLTFARNSRAVWSGRYGQVMNIVLLAGLIALALLPTRHAFADGTTTAFDTSKIIPPLQTAINAIKLLAAIGFVILSVIGTATMMGSGVYDGARMKAPRILWGAAIGAVALFFLAVPLANLLLTAAGQPGNLFT